MTRRGNATARSRRNAGLQLALADARSGRVVFVSHCLLNQNTRYLGGALCPGVVTGAIDRYVADGTGIVQMPCPEQRCWGGVLKTRFLWLLRHRRIARAAAPIFDTFATPYLRHRHRRLAHATARDVADYLASGYTVTGIVGVAGSPSCGVHQTLDMHKALATIGGSTSSTTHRVTARWLNDDVIAPATCPGRGLFVDALQAELDRRHITVAFTEHTQEPSKAGAPWPRFAAASSSTLRSTSSSTSSPTNATSRPTTRN